jgi:hypothetical protein
MNNNQRIDRVYFDQSVNPTRLGYIIARANVLACSYLYPEGAAFYVVFDSNITLTTIGSGSLNTHFPSAQVFRYSRPPMDMDGRSTIIGHADVTIYVDGVQKSVESWDIGCREEKWKFQFDLRVQIVEGSGGQNMRELVVGLQQMACFSLVLSLQESTLVLRSDNPISNRGYMRLH